MFSLQSFDMRPHKPLGKLQSADKVCVLSTPCLVSGRFAS